MSHSSAKAVSFLTILYLILKLVIPLIGNIYAFSSPPLNYGNYSGNNSDIDNQDTLIENTNIWLLLYVNQNISLIIGR